MTTRIDGNQGAPIPPQIERAESGKQADRANKPAARTESKADRVEVSPDAEFVHTAVQAAHETPAIREDKVMAAKKALADGTLGQDALTLAEALLDHLLEDKK
jgi:flagellar biosynthesis anti-sigma factor FlgM